MKIIRLTAENIKRLKVVDLAPDQTMQVVSGKNASGKSSLLDSIFYALGGKDAIPGKPVRDGCDKALVRLNLGTLLVERKFTAAGGTSLSITNDEGLSYKSPQTMLDAMLGELTFDPLAFTRLKPADQVAELLRISKVSIDVQAIDRANQVDYDERTRVNREAKQKRAQAEAIVVPPDAPEEIVDESVYLDKIQNAATFNADVERRRQNRIRAQGEVVALRRQAGELRDEGVAQIRGRVADRVAELQRKIREVQEDGDAEADKAIRSADALTSTAAQLESQLASAGELPELMSITDLRTSLDSCKVRNAAFMKREDRINIKEEAASLESVAKSITDRISERDKQKVDAIRTAKMPIDGLGFGFGCITFGGVPFDQASSAEQLRVSASIAMAGNPQLRIIRIKDGGLLDEDSMKLLSEMAADREYQVWVESVHAGSGVGIVMEDGQVQGHAQVEVRASCK